MDNPDLIKDILGLEVDAARQEILLVAYRDILREIEKLRGLDLTDVHPAVVFAPASGIGADI
jgi:hypothetical protein